MKKFPTNDGQEIITTNIDWIQTAKEEALKDRHTDWFTDGIVSQSSGTPFAFTSNGDGTISIGSGVGYISGERIAIEDTDTTEYDSTLPDQVTSDNIGGDTPTPKSTGCKNITVPVSTTYHIGIKYLLICDSSNTTSPTNYALHPITSKRLFYKWDDGYEIQVNTVKANLFDGDSDYLYLGYVTRGTGTDISLYMIDRSISTVKGSLLLGQTLLIEDGAVTGVKLSPSVAGNGLSKDSLGDLQVNVDDSTIEIINDVLRVKDLGILTAKLNSFAVTEGKIGALAVTETKISTDAVTTTKIKDGAIIEDKLGTGAVTPIKITNNIASISLTDDFSTLSGEDIVTRTGASVTLNNVRSNGNVLLLLSSSWIVSGNTPTAIAFGTAKFRINIDNGSSYAYIGYCGNQIAFTSAIVNFYAYLFNVTGFLYLTNVSSGSHIYSLECSSGSDDQQLYNRCSEPNFGHLRMLAMEV